MAQAEEDVRSRLLAAAMARLAARRIEYNRRNWELIGSLLEVLCLRQREGAGELTLDEIMAASGLAAGRLAGYLRNLRIGGIVEEVREPGAPRSQPAPAWRLHVAELLEEAPLAAPGLAAADGPVAPIGVRPHRPADPAARRAPRARRPGELAPELFANGYLASHPELRDQYAGQLALLSDWVDAHPEPPAAPVHGNERSFEVFNDEKFLGVERNRRALAQLGFDDARLGISSTRSGYLFAMGAHPARVPTVLLVENHASYDSLAHLLTARRGRLDLLGERVDGVLHSNGSAVNTLARVEEYVESFGYREFRMLYWGDIDRSGVSELEAALATAGHPIEPFAPLYAACVEKQLGRLRRGLPIERAGDAERACDVEAFARRFEGPAADVVRIVLLNALRIPQEIMTRTDLEALLPPERRLPVARVARRALMGAARAAGFAAGLAASAGSRVAGRLEG